jgi:hypothetical protein
MAPEIVALIDKPHLFIAVLAVGAVCGMLVEQLAARMRRQAWKKSKGRNWSAKRPDLRLVARPSPATNDSRVKAIDAADQLRIVMGANFSRQPLLNKGETRVFQELNRLVRSCNSSWQVMAQVSLGEILSSDDPDAYGCINSKRVDLLLMDGDCAPQHAIEYQGGGHYLGTAAARDAVKKEALRRAGIGYHEVVAGHTTPADLKALVERLLGPPKAGYSQKAG